MPTNTALVDRVVRLPLQPISAIAVLKGVKNPDASSASLARLVEVDPALSAKSKWMS